ncbi:unnamed protein product [Menidia menidia]|uniref:(Atlantic silverside) hypothetical protein n=1 Tax=Menidia menidia TaxID=238744 RepID=A0A8S4AF39_9TELE|nr:unnamed protein product [Menidia menidia]
MKIQLNELCSSTTFLSASITKLAHSQSWPYKDSCTPDHTSAPESMEAKAKSGAPAPKAATKVEKKEPVAPRKADPAPAAPEPEIPPPAQDGAADAESAAAGAGDEAAASGTDSLEHLKPFLIGGVVIAAGAILVGVLLLARRN